MSELSRFITDRLRVFVTQFVRRCRYNPIEALAFVTDEITPWFSKCEGYSYTRL